MVSLFCNHYTVQSTFTSYWYVKAKKLSTGPLISFDVHFWHSVLLLHSLPQLSYPVTQDITGSVLTHTGGDVVQVGVQGAGAQLLVVCDVGLQKGDTKLPLVHHADQAAPGLAGGLPCNQEEDQDQYIHTVSLPTH